MKLSFKKRIATYFMMATSILLIVVFSAIYLTVHQTVYSNIDNDLTFEASKHLDEIEFDKKIIRFSDRDEWKEKEHINVQVNPVFLQLNDENGLLKDKSPNLKLKTLTFNKEVKPNEHFTAVLINKAIRQVQIPVIKDGTTKGYILSAMSFESSLMVLRNLRNTLFILFPIVLIGLFFTSSFLAGRSIKPVMSITGTTNRITKNNLNERVELPQHDDELFDLSSAINALLERIENAIVREKQFTSDASHELRTPLSVLQGTLEVLLRKPRTEIEYREKIEFSLKEIDRMTNIINELLEIARLDSNPLKNEKNEVDLNLLLKQIVEQNKTKILVKKIQIIFPFFPINEFKINSFYANLIINNILSNAIKYSNKGGEIRIHYQFQKGRPVITIEDFGIGIAKDDLKLIFNPFFRSNSLNHKQITGEGLGLSIVQKAAKAIAAKVEIESQLGIGTKVTILF